MTERGNTEVPNPAGGVIVINEPMRSDFAPNLGGAVEYRLAHVIYALARITGGGLGEFAGSFFVHALEILRPELVRYVSPFLDEILDIPDLPSGFRQFIQNVREGEGQAAAALLSGIGSTAGGAAVGSLLPTLLSPATYALAHALTPARPSPAEAWAMYFRGYFDENTVEDQLMDTGWHPTIIQAFKQILRPRPSEPDLFQAAFREGTDLDKVTQELERRGWGEADIRMLETLSRPIPGPGDQVRFALREAWRNDIADKFGYDEDMPGAFTEWMGKLGFDEVWARNFWRSHWDLPSIQAGFEMLHRRVIDEDTLDTLLRVADIPSFWRDTLKAISYRPYTRVDVRRMHSIGILSDEELVDSYRDLGFDLEHAQGMAQFTILYNTRTDREYSEGEIREGYRIRAISYDDAMALLLGIGQSQEHAAYVLAIEDYKQVQKLQNAQIEIIEDRYIAGDIDRVSALSQLGEIGLLGDRIGLLIQEWDLAKERAISRPTKSDVRQFYKEAIIGRENVRDELLHRQVPATAIGWYLELWDSEIAKEQQAELEKQQKEQERLETATFKTARMVEIQRINVLIAEQRTIIADANLALTEIRPPEQVTELEEIVRSLGVETQRRNIQIQEKRNLIDRTQELIRVTPEPEIVTQLQTEIDQSEEKIVNLQVQREAHQTEVARLDTLIAELEEEPAIIVQLQSEIDTSEETIAALQVDRDALQTEIAELDVQISESEDADEIYEMQQEQIRLARDIEEKDDDIAKEKEHLTSLRNTLAVTPVPQVYDLQQEQIRLAYEIEKVEDDITTEREYMLTLRNTLAAVPEPEVIEELHRKITDLEAQINELKLDISDIRFRIAQNKAELERMPTPEQAILLQQQILTARAEISRLQLEKARVPVTPE